MSLREAGINDLYSIISIENKSYKKPYWNEHLLRYLFNKSTTDSAWIFELGKKTIGFLLEQRCLNEISILNVAVDKKYRNNGFGKEIIGQYISLIPVNSVVFLEVNKNNFIARRIYTEFNFREVKIRENYYNNGEDALIMRYEKNSN